MRKPNFSKKSERFHSPHNDIPITESILKHHSATFTESIPFIERSNYSSTFHNLPKNNIKLRTFFTFNFILTYLFNYLLISTIVGFFVSPLSPLPRRSPEKNGKPKKKQWLSCKAFILKSTCSCSECVCNSSLDC